MKNKVKGLFAAIKVCMATIWKEAPKYLVWEIIITILRGVMPALLTYIGALILKQLTDVTSSGTFLVCIIYIFIDYILNILNSGGIDGFYNRYSSYEKTILKRRLSALGQKKILQMNSRCFYEDKFNISRNVSNVASISVFFESLRNTARSTVTLISILALLISIEPLFVLLVVIFTIPSFIASNKIEEMKKKMKEKLSYTNSQTGHIRSILFGQADAETKIFKSKDFFLEIWKKNRLVLLKNNLVLWLRSTFFTCLVSILSNIGGILCLLIIVYKCVQGKSDIADVAIAIAVMNNVQSAIAMTSFRYDGMVSNITNFNMYTDFIDSKEYAQMSGPVKLESINEIRLDHVSFTYKNDGIYALHNINLTLNAREYVAFVGKNGSGKTTLIKLICGLYIPTEGTIYYNGVPHTEVDRESLFRQFSVLYQKFGEYPLTLRDNIIFGSELDDERLEKTGKHAGLGEIVKDCPQGYDTMLFDLYDGGVNLSHGQWQRVAVARAFYKKSDVLMMDEPSSAIDPITEKEVYSSMEHYEEAKIRLLVSHRMSYMKETSRIIMLEDGYIIEEGTFEELSENEGAFRKLYNIQALRYQNINE